MNHQPQFQRLIEAIASLKIFPETIEEFTKLLKQRYQRKHSPKDLEWIDKLCGNYHDNCYNYVKFIKRVFAAQFLAKCLTAEEDAQRKNIITELKANTDAAMKSGGRLDRFMGNTNKKQVLENIDEVLAQMEHMQKKEAKKQKYFQKFSSWLKEKVLDQVSVVFAKVIGPLWDMISENVVLAVQSDYDHDTLILAVETIGKDIPLMEKSIEDNRYIYINIEWTLVIKDEI